MCAFMSTQRQITMIIGTYTNKTHIHTHIKAHYEMSQLAYVEIFLIKFHLQWLGFHHPITGRRAEMLLHAWFHQAPGKYQSMPPILFYFSPSITFFLPSLLPSPSWTSILTSSLPFFQSFYYPEISLYSLLFLSISLSHARESHVTAWFQQTQMYCVPAATRLPQLIIPF